MDMWEPDIRSTTAHLPDAHRKIVFDQYHVAQPLNEAVDKVRRHEHRELVADWMRWLLFDSQTSGGLMMAVPPERAATTLRRLHGRGAVKAAVVGTVVKEPAGKMLVTASAQSRAGHPRQVLRARQEF